MKLRVMSRDKPGGAEVEECMCSLVGDENLSCIISFWGFPGGSDGKESASKQETQLWSLGQEDPLEKEMASHYNIFAWKSHRQQSLEGYSLRDPIVLGQRKTWVRLKLVWFLFVWSPKFCLLIIHPVDKISECCERPILLYLKKKIARD